jgi:hypothetical protein
MRCIGQCAGNHRRHCAVSAKYFKGLKVIFKSDAEALDTLAHRARGLADDYNKLADLVATIPFWLRSDRMRRQD